MTHQTLQWLVALLCDLQLPTDTEPQEGCPPLFSPHNRHNYFKSDSRKETFVALEQPKTEMVEKHPHNLFMC